MDVATLAFAKNYLRDYWRGERVVLKRQGKLLQLCYQQNYLSKSSGTKRGSISTFSRPARLRLLKWVATVKWEELPKGCFLTLTYPDDCWQCDNEQRTQQRSQLVRDMENYLGKKIYGVWRVEWKARQRGRCVGQIVQHWHLLWMNVGYIPYRYLRLRWEKIIGTKEHCQIKMKKLQGSEQAGLYVSKYVAKVNENGILDNPSYLNITGRHYGYFRKSDVPTHPCEWYRGLTDLQIEYCVLAAAAKLPWINPKDPMSFTVLGDLANFIGEELDKLGLTQDESDLYNYNHQGGARAASEMPSRRPLAVAAPLF